VRRFVSIAIEEEHGAAGKFVTDHFQRAVLRGYEVSSDYVSGDKVSRAKPWCALAESGNVRLLKGGWNRAFLAEATAFPRGAHLDQCDSVSGAYKYLATIQRVIPAYIPVRHCLPFDRSEKAFVGIPEESVVLWVSLWMEKDASVGGVACAWSRKSRKLRVYGEMRAEVPAPDAVSAAVREMSVMPLTKSKPGKLGVDRIYGNEKMFAGGHDAAKVYKEAIGAKPNVLYEEVGSLIAVARMLAEDRLIVHSECRQTDVELRSWCIDDGKPLSGFPLARAILSIVCLLRVEGELEEKPEPRPYSAEKARIRKRLRGDMEAPIKEDHSDDWLAV
jgi:hypothetical protein